MASFQRLKLLWGKEVESGGDVSVLQATPHPDYRSYSLPIPNNSPWVHVQFSFIDPRIGHFSPSIKVAEKQIEEVRQCFLAFLIMAKLLFISFWNLSHQPCWLRYGLYSPQSWGEAAHISPAGEWLISLSGALSTFWREASGGLGLCVEATLSCIKCPGAVEVNSDSSIYSNCQA